jgi:hypothetical protein
MQQALKIWLAGIPTIEEIVGRGFSLTTSTELPDGPYVVECHKICDGWSRVTNEWILIKQGHARSFRFEHTIYWGRELSDRLAGAGFVDVKLFGDRAGRPYNWEANRLVIKATKSERTRGPSGDIGS